MLKHSCNKLAVNPHANSLSTRAFYPLPSPLPFSTRCQHASTAFSFQGHLKVTYILWGEINLMFAFHLVVYNRSRSKHREQWLELKFRRCKKPEVKSPSAAKRQTFKNTSVTKHLIPLTFSYFVLISISHQLQQQQHSPLHVFCGQQTNRPGNPNPRTHRGGDYRRHHMGRGWG